MRQYETMVIIDAMISDEAIQHELKKIETKILAGGEIVRRDDWGKRKMAYDINKKSHGYVAIIWHKSGPTIVADLERDFRINENVLRWMSIADHPLPSEVPVIIEKESDDNDGED